jgi:hypothetical protein
MFKQTNDIFKLTLQESIIISHCSRHIYSCSSVGENYVLSSASTVSVSWVLTWSFVIHPIGIHHECAIFDFISRLNHSFSVFSIPIIFVSHLLSFTFNFLLSNYFAFISLPSFITLALHILNFTNHFHYFH